LRSPADALALLRPYPAELMERWPVSEHVNSVKVGGPNLIQPVAVSPRVIQPARFDSAA
jgi:putative SOS response-associated peptidase YedK